MTERGTTPLPDAIRRLLFLAGLRGNTPTEVADLVRALQDRQLAPKEAQAALETVRLDLTVLDELAAQLARQKPVPDDAPGRLPSLSTEDILAVQDAARLLARRGGPHHARLAQVAEQLGSRLPEHLRPRSVSHSPGAGPDALHVARQAWATRTPLQFGFLTVGQHARRQTVTLHVHRIATDPDTLEALITGRDVTRDGELRSFPVSRIVGTRLLDGASYDIPDEFSPLLPTQTVTLRFTGEARFRILTGGHAFLSEPTINPDGSIDVNTDVALDHGGLPTGILPWALGWGPDVQIVSPAPLRAHWADMLTRMVETAHRSPTVFVRGNVA